MQPLVQLRGERARGGGPCGALRGKQPLWSAAERQGLVWRSRGVHYQVASSQRHSVAELGYSQELKLKDFW